MSIGTKNRRYRGVEASIDVHILCLSWDATPRCAGDTLSSTRLDEATMSAPRKTPAVDFRFAGVEDTAEILALVSGDCIRDQSCTSRTNKKTSPSLEPRASCARQCNVNSLDSLSKYDTSMIFVVVLYDTYHMIWYRKCKLDSHPELSSKFEDMSWIRPAYHKTISIHIIYLVDSKANLAFHPYRAMSFNFLFAWEYNLDIL